MTTVLKFTAPILRLRCTTLRQALFCILYGKEVEFVTSSLRVDRVAAHGLGLSRRNIDLAFLSKLLVLNGNVVKKKSVEVKTGDVIDLLRKDECNQEIVKFDSVKILEMLERTSKGKERVLLTRKRGVVMEWGQFKERFN